MKSKTEANHAKTGSAFFKDAFEKMRNDFNKQLKDNGLLIATGNSRFNGAERVLSKYSQIADQIGLSIQIDGFSPEYFTFDNFCKLACLKSGFDTLDEFAENVDVMLLYFHSEDSNFSNGCMKFLKKKVVKKSEVESYVKDHLKEDVIAFINKKINEEENKIAESKLSIARSKDTIKRLKKIM